MDTTVRVVRIYINEADHGRGSNMMQEILNVLHDQHRVRGVTVFRGIAGFGSAGQVHAADILRLTVDLPLVIEFFDQPAVVDAVLELLDGLVPRGHIIAWDANCRTT
jgi:PII-like signaling protein